MNFQLNEHITDALSLFCCDADNLDAKIRLLDELTDLLLDESSEPDIDPNIAVERLDQIRAIRDLQKFLTSLRTAL